MARFRDASTLSHYPNPAPYRTCYTTRQHVPNHRKKGCLLIFFSNFLALTIKAEVASPTSSGSTVYSIVLVICNLMFFMAVFLNTWAATKEAVANKDVTVRAYPPAYEVIGTVSPLVQAQMYHRLVQGAVASDCTLWFGCFPASSEERTAVTRPACPPHPLRKDSARRVEAVWIPENTRSFNLRLFVFSVSNATTGHGLWRFRARCRGPERKRG